MAGRPKPPGPSGDLPSKQDILDFLAEHPGPAGKREIARHFNIKGAQRIPLKRMLKELAAEGLIDRQDARSFAPTDRLPPVTVMTISGFDQDGELLCRPNNWRSEDDPPTIYLLEQGAGKPMGLGDRFLGRLTKTPDHYEATVIRRLENSEKAAILGVYQKGLRGGVVQPVDKRAKGDYAVSGEDSLGARTGELVLCSPKSRQSGGPRQVRVTQRLGAVDEPRSISLIAIHEHGIPFEFPPEVLAQAAAAQSPTLGKRTDLRELPLITIDPPDARDHDDAVWAGPDEDPANEGGVVVVVAIADVAHYVSPGSALDKEARKRGNSCYFPDRVVPMLPEELSADLCSLKPNVDRACLAVRLVFAANGRKRSHKFHRALMKSHARLSYAQVEDARLGNFDGETKALQAEVLAPLWRAFEVVNQGRERRQPLDLDIPETKIEMNEAGVIERISTPQTLLSQKLIEEFMIQANVAAAETLERRTVPCVYRIHDSPSEEKLEALREVLSSTGFKLAKGQVIKPALFNRLIHQAKGSPFEQLIGEMVLRSQSQARYNPDNIGHFGLNLGRYAHFTSPIRRYADLLVHRGLITAHGFGEDGLTPFETKNIGSIAEDISNHERRALAAERDTTDRYMAAYLEPRLGETFEGRIVGATRFGLFVKLVENGADGLLPMRALPNDYYIHDEKAHALVGERTGRRFQLGETIDVAIAEAAPLSGGLRYTYAGEDAPRDVKAGRRPGARTHSAGKATRAKPGETPRKGKVTRGRRAEEKAAAAKASPSKSRGKSKAGKTAKAKARKAKKARG